MKKFTITMTLVSILLTLGCSKPVRQQHDAHTHPDTTSYASVVNKVDQLNQQFGPDQVLVVLDIDNTILTSDVDLGGDVWYQWQRGKLAVKPTPEQKVGCLFEDAIGLLYELSTMSLTEPEVPALIESWQNQGNTVFALTSRSPKYRAATERELGRYGVDFTPTALRPVGADVPVLAGNLSRPYSYIRGIMMTTGMNKGTMLKHILEATNRQFKAMVFVDDSHKNVENLAQAYQGNEAQLHIFHYTKIEADRIQNTGSVLTQEQADQMGIDWAALNQVLKQVFPGRDVAPACIGS